MRYGEFFQPFVLAGLGFLLLSIALLPSWRRR
jgi:hypothetical protein